MESAPAELVNRWGDPAFREIRSALLEELLRWTLRASDDLPGAAYVPKRAERNFHASRA